MCFNRGPAALALLLLICLPGCGDRTLGPEHPEALGIGTNRTIYAVSSRALTDSGLYGSERSTELSLLELTVSIPPTHQPGQLSFGLGRGDPLQDFVIARRQVFDSAQAFQARLDRDVARLPPAERDVSIFVHGYNATQAETAFRAAQIAEDVGLPGLHAIYSWPSRGNPLGYVYDHDSMLFARDGLERLLLAAGTAGPKRVVLVAHSMGALLAMETLRQIEIAQPGWAAHHLGGVVLIAPDVDVDVFRSQVARMSVLPQPFVIFVSGRDRVLSLSAFLRGTGKDERLGTLSTADRVADLPVLIVDTTNYSAEAASPHLVAVTSPTMVALLRDAAKGNPMFGDDMQDLANLSDQGTAVYRSVPRPSEVR